jgi:hypothetical protein
MGYFHSRLTRHWFEFRNIAMQHIEKLAVRRRDHAGHIPSVHQNHRSRRRADQRRSKACGETMAVKYNSEQKNPGAESTTPGL